MIYIIYIHYLIYLYILNIYVYIAYKLMNKYKLIISCVSI